MHRHQKAGLQSRRHETGMPETVKRAWLCPGQGSQYRGMGRGFFFETVPAVRRLFEEAESISGLPLREISQHGDQAALRDCAVLEPLLLSFALSYMLLLRERGEQPAAVAGYSAGELAALCCAGVLTQREALEIASDRGRILQAAAARIGGHMLALLGLPAATVERIVAAQRGVVIGGWNAPDHVTVVGDVAAVQAVGDAALAAGAQIQAVDVAAAWHSPLADAAARRVAVLLERYSFRSPRLPFYSSVSGRRETDPERLRLHLSEQVRKPVLWHGALRELSAQTGVYQFYETGAGRALRTMSQRIPLSAAPGGRAQFLSFYVTNSIPLPSVHRQEVAHA